MTEPNYPKGSQNVLSSSSSETPYAMRSAKERRVASRREQQQQQQQQQQHVLRSRGGSEPQGGGTASPFPPNPSDMVALSNQTGRRRSLRSLTENDIGQVVFVRARLHARQKRGKRLVRVMLRDTDEVGWLRSARLVDGEVRTSAASDDPPSCGNRPANVVFLPGVAFVDGHGDNNTAALSSAEEEKEKESQAYLIDFIGKVPCESIVDVVATVVAATSPAIPFCPSSDEASNAKASNFMCNGGTTQEVVEALPNLPIENRGTAASSPRRHASLSYRFRHASPIELRIHSNLQVVSRAASNGLPFTLEDASAPDDEDHLSPAPCSSSSLHTHPISQSMRWDYRWLDLRTPSSNAIARLRSRVTQYWREMLLSETFSFVEVHTPKLVNRSVVCRHPQTATPSLSLKEEETEERDESCVVNCLSRNDYACCSSWNNFHVRSDNGDDVVLVRSPQPFLQMALQGDLEGVFEVGPVFRAEPATSHRHLTEFTALHFEMRIQSHYHEVWTTAERVIHSIVSKLKETHREEIAAVAAQYGDGGSSLQWQVSDEVMDRLGIGVVAGDDGKVDCSHTTEEFVASPCRSSTDLYNAYVHNRQLRMLRFSHASCVQLLKDYYAANTCDRSSHAAIRDLEERGESSFVVTEERLLSRLVHARYGVDLFGIERLPLHGSSLTTMPSRRGMGAAVGNSFYVLLRGDHILSGRQRIHDDVLVAERYKNNKNTTTNVRHGNSTEPQLCSVHGAVLDSLRQGAWPHGGVTVGLERFLMQYLNLPNIRLASLFPRDPHRCHP